MSYVWKQNLVSSSKYATKCPYALTPKYITIHDTANSAPAANEASYCVNNNFQTGFHVAVDEKEAIQVIPFERNAWHAGDGANGTGNRQSIGIEICRPTNSNRSLYDQAEENAVYVAARLLYKYGLGIDRLKKHQDWSGKHCPNVILSEKRWEGFKGRVEWVLNEIKKGNIKAELSSGTTGLTNQAQPVNPTTSNSNSSSQASPSSTFKLGSNNVYGLTTDSLNVRSKRNASSSIVTTIPKGAKVLVGYALYIDNKAKPSSNNDSLWGGVTYNGKTGFVNLKYVRPTSDGNSSYKIKVVNCSLLNARRGAGTNYPVAETVKAGTVLTIVGESNGWLKTKSGLYISKAYTQKI